MAAIRRAAAVKALAQALMGARGPGQPGIGDRLRAVPRMLSQGFGGQYPYLKKSRVALVLFGFLYVLSPVDLVPEVILPLIGLGDDALVVAWLAGAVLSETDAFLSWEKSRSTVVDGDIVTGEVIG
jgi:uncharacterized membrane protein YkvA (DUF1232 family)